MSIIKVVKKKVVKNMKLKEYRTYIEILIKNFNDVITTRSNKKAEALWDTAKFFLSKEDLPQELRDVVFLMDKYFKAYNDDPKGVETLKLENKLKLVA